MTHEKFMRRAIELSREKMSAGQGGPFAAIVVKDGSVIGEGWNQVTSHNDPTAHAEIVAIRQACNTLGDFSLEGAVIYATCEPCPMCLAAIYWARLSALYYANSTGDAESIGFDDGAFYRELALPSEMRSMPHVRLLAEEARAVFDEWLAMDDRVEY
jgi:tRNA(Arg) A34 adenosine deaminase TadA